ncbi:hypothetical protein BX616_001226 [Lobosporangium transversale]|uniref:F-box domain-containing protein n=1 Tax=Lobosporangium transversale TaxID=64571 RepID=A0A1Y2GY78_9FUNG|nr:hypothetical protein BCR41DRAFT_346519 [Lobosporangium transversale]KAF9917366.1 hypothetical protein BX616_001226 [Lobosporangium transversale]ORZ27226.1 hypothetical protein BCR41DRAFT_346519 [Lobosporangium transversale]|eukprot:XP_021884953.1 hypothetical protein BCR41DRAFT_346519 [Lobosporangium transversale]
MHPPTALSIVLLQPLIRDEIAACLSQSDLACCTRVNTAWNIAFAPRLWRDVFLANQQIISLLQSSSAAQQGLCRNAEHVRSIRSFFCYAFQSLAGIDEFPNLVRLDSLASELHNKGIVDHTNTQRLLQFVKMNMSLREIILSNFPLASIKMSKLLGDTIALHPGLISVTINCFREPNLLSIQHVLRGVIVSKVEKLSLICRADIVSTPETITGSLDYNKSSIGLNVSSNIGLDISADVSCQDLPEAHVASALKDLRLEANIEHVHFDILLSILRTSPNLEHLYVPCINTDESFQALSSTIQGYCPRLRHITSGFSHSKDEHMALLLNSCYSLRSYITDSEQPLGPLTINSLLHHQHSLTLEQLSIKSCSSIASKHIQLILTTCPKLTSFEALPSHHWQETYSPRLNIKDLPVHVGSGQPAWVCLGLRDLKIGFTGFSALPDSEPAHPYVEHIYKQLACMTQLRTLHLAGEFDLRMLHPESKVWCFDFTLASGLGHLETLTNLRTLSVQRLKHHRIGNKERAWMAQHWLNLTAFYTTPAHIQTSREVRQKGRDRDMGPLKKQALPVLFTFFKDLWSSK